jgi:hypothetical protein
MSRDMVVGKIEQLTEPDSGILFIRKIAMKKSKKGYQESDISVSEWMEAEARARESNTHPKPPGSITVEEFARMRGISRAHAQTILRSLYMAGEATREKWLPGNRPPMMVYWLVKKK